MKWPLIISLALISCCITCSKDYQTEDASKPEIEIIYPLDVPKLIPGQPLCLKAIIKDNRQITKVSWEIIDNSVNILLHREEFRLQEKSFVLESKYLIPDAWNGEHDVKIIATDQTGNTTFVKIPFQVNQ
jgi:Domain of unknown function (DUF4625)